MPRHTMHWPAFVLAIGLLIALTTFFLNGAAQPSIPLPSHSDDGPSAITDSQGRFRFEGLHNASHLLRLDPQTLPSGVEPASADLVLTLSPSVTRSLPVAPGLILRATYHDDGAVLDGVLFQDTNGDGQQSPDELGLAGARVIDPNIYQYFVPLQNDTLIQSFTDVLNSPCLGAPSTDPRIDSRISLTASSTPTVIYYDQWEDGYDADPTVPGPTTERLTLNAGQFKIWHESSSTPHTLPYDGKDRITIIGQPASLVRAAWLNDPGTRLAGAWEMQKVSDWGQHYVIPVGEDIGRGGTQTFGDFDYVSVSVMAAYDNTSVTVVADPLNPSTTTKTYTLNAGQTAFVRGTANQPPISVHSGATVDSSLPVQVQVRGGNCRARYSGRSYSLVPVERWATDYWSPVSSFFTGANGCQVRYLQTQPNSSADVDIYIYNPGAAALPVTYEDASGTGTLTIPPKSTGSYLNLHPKPLTRSNTRGVHLTAPGPFSAVTAVDSTSLGNDGADFDWSYTLVPARDLSAQVVLGWAPGTNPPPAPFPGRVNGSTAYVQATADGTRVFARLDPDQIPDQFDTDGNGTLSAASSYGFNELTSNQGILLNKGQMVRVSDPNDHDMTGAIIYSQDNLHQLAVVWGEDACIAGPQQPYLDLGYTVLPLPIPDMAKNSRLLVDADRSGDISPGDTIEYNIQVNNSGFGPILDPILIDTLPYTYTDFLLASITSSPTPKAPGVQFDNGNGLFNYVPNGLPGTPDPNVHSIKAAYPNLAPGSGIVITLRIVLDRQLPPNVLAVVNNASMCSSNTPCVKVPNRVYPNHVDLLACKTDGRTSVNPGDTLTYTIPYTNAGPGIAYNVVMTDTLPPTAINVSSPTVPGVITPTIQPGRVIFQLGTLPAGKVGQTTLSLTLGPNTPKGVDVINTIQIGTRSHEDNPTNNSCTDIDKVPGPTAVVLSEFSAERQAGGVLVHWRTVAEQDNYGFRVYRSATPNRANAVLLTPAIIPGQGRGRADGASYNFLDTGAPAGTLYYWLEDIDLNGASEFHGPAQPTIQSAQYRVFVPIVAAGR